MGAITAVFAFIPKRLLFAAAGLVAGVTLLVGVYAYGKHEGRQRAAVDALQTSVKILRERNEIDETVSHADAAALCRDYGLHDDQLAECLRRLGEAEAKP